MTPEQVGKACHWLRLQSSDAAGKFVKYLEATGTKWMFDEEDEYRAPTAVDIRKTIDGLIRESEAGYYQNDQPKLIKAQNNEINIVFGASDETLFARIDFRESIGRTWDLEEEEEEDETPDYFSSEEEE